MNCIDIADAVAAEINGGDFDFTAKRRLFVEWGLGDLEESKVSVVPKTVEITVADRASDQHEFEVNIGYQKRIAPGRDIEEAIPQLLADVDRVIAHLKRKRLSALPQAAWVGSQNELLYSPTHLRESRVFTSLITITYRAMI